MPWCRVSTAPHLHPPAPPAPQLPQKRGDTLVTPYTHGAHLLKCAGVKKLRKKKEEKGEEESDKDPGSKPTREPRKKKESLPLRSRVAKGPKKQQGGGRHTPLCEHPLVAPHVPLHVPVHPVPPVPSMCRGLGMCLGGFLAKTQSCAWAERGCGSGPVGTALAGDAGSM